MGACDGGAFGAEREAIGGGLVIDADNALSGVEEQAGGDLEAGMRAMGFVECGSGGVGGVCEGGGQFLARYDLHDRRFRNESVGGMKAREKTGKRSGAGRLVLYRRALGGMVV